MALWQGESNRKKTGGRLIHARNKRRFEVGRESQDTLLGQHKQKLIRTKGAHQKVQVLTTNKINVTDKKSGKTAPATIKTVTENPANIHYVRRNIITQGAVVDTSAGKVRVTSRPGQHGTLNGVMV